MHENNDRLKTMMKRNRICILYILANLIKQEKEKLERIHNCVSNREKKRNNKKNLF
jgi:hypothetical protein